MIEGLAIPLGVANLSAVGLLIVLITFFILSIVRGWIVMKFQVDDIIESKQHYRAASEKKDETIATLSRTIQDQYVVGETVKRVMSAIQEHSEADK